MIFQSRYGAFRLRRRCASWDLSKLIASSAWSQSGEGSETELHTVVSRLTWQLPVELMRRKPTVATLIGAGLILASTAIADPYNPAERALGGGLVGAGTGAVIGAIAGGGRGAGIGAAVGGGVGALAGAATTPPRPHRRYYHHHVVHRYY